MPRNEPSAVPRSTGAQERLKSSLVGHRFFTSFVKISRLSFSSRLATISAVPNIPIATMTKPMPSESSGMLKVKRSTPELTRSEERRVGKECKVRGGESEDTDKRSAGTYEGR